MKKIVLIASLALSLGAISNVQAADDPAAAIAAAEAARSEAAKVGFEWRDTAQLIEEAKKAASEGDAAKAVALAQQAQRQSENAVKQSQAVK